MERSKYLLERTNKLDRRNRPHSDPA